MEMENKLENSQNEDDQGPFLSSKVKDIFKSRNKEKKQKKLKKMNLTSLLPSEEQDFNTDNNINNTKVIKLDNNSNVFIRPNKPYNINHSLNNKFYLNNKSNSYNEFVKENNLDNNLHKSNQSNQGKNSQVQTIRIPIDKSQVAHYKFNY